MSRCFFCRKPTPKGIIRCDNCTTKTAAPGIALKGKNWGANSNTERLKKWNKNQPPTEKRTTLDDIGMI